MNDEGGARMYENRPGLLVISRMQSEKFRLQPFRLLPLGRIARLLLPSRSPMPAPLESQLRQ
jgi:hypothetical protein